MESKLTIESSIQNLRLVEDFTEEIAREINISEADYGKVLVSVMEAVNNAIIHGNKSQERKIVEILYKCEDDALTVTVTDEGEGFNPSLVPDPTTPENIEKIRGRGVFLMSKLADKIEFNKMGNSVTMTFKSSTP